MSELLQFIYQGKVCVKHTELTAFMQVAQTLQIKGLASATNEHPQFHQSGHHSPSSPFNSSSKNSTSNIADNYPMNLIESKLNSALYNSASIAAQKRDLPSSGGPSNESSYHKRRLKRTSDSIDNDISAESMENVSSDDIIYPPIPQISMVDPSRYDLPNVKRESSESLNSPGGIRNLGALNFDYSYNKGAEYPNEIHMNNDLMRGSGSCGSSTSGTGATGGGSGNHMDIPPGKLFFTVVFVCIAFCFLCICVTSRLHFKISCFLICLYHFHNSFAIK